MKTNNYLDSVVAHIKQKELKQAVKNELYDHLDEVKKEHLADGYDATGALAIAETAMGDADAVGEQLDAVHGSRFRKKLGTALFIISTVLFVFADSVVGRLVLLPFFSLSSDYSIRIENLLFPFYATGALLHNAVIVPVLLLNVIVSLRNKRFVYYVTGFLYLIFHLWSGASVIASMLVAVFNGENIINCLLTRSVIHQMLTVYSVETGAVKNQTIVVNVLLTAVLAVLFVIGLRYLKKVKQLRNSARDVKMNKVLKAILTGILVFCIGGSIVCLVPIYNANAISAELRQEMTDAEKQLIANAAAFHQVPPDACLDFANQTFPEYTNTLDADTETLQRDIFLGLWATSALPRRTEIVGETDENGIRQSNTSALQALINSDSGFVKSKNLVSVVVFNSPYGNVIGVANAVQTPEYNFLASDDSNQDYAAFHSYSKQDIEKVPLQSSLQKVPLPSSRMAYCDGKVIVIYEMKVGLMVLSYTYDEASGDFLLTKNEYIALEQ